MCEVSFYEYWITFMNKLECSYESNTTFSSAPLQISLFVLLFKFMQVMLSFPLYLEEILCLQLLYLEIKKILFSYPVWQPHRREMPTLYRKQSDDSSNMVLCCD